MCVTTVKPKRENLIKNVSEIKNMTAKKDNSSNCSAYPANSLYFRKIEGAADEAPRP